MLKILTIMPLATALTTTTQNINYSQTIEQDTSITINAEKNSTTTIEIETAVSAITVNSNWEIENFEMLLINNTKETKIVNITNLNGTRNFYAAGFIPKDSYIIKNTNLDKYLSELGIKNVNYNNNQYEVYDYNFTDTTTTITTQEVKTSMEELLTALSTAVQSAVSIFVEGFGGLTQIFYTGTEITFIGGILVVGLAVMFLMMFLRWIVSFVRGI